MGQHQHYIQVVNVHYNKICFISCLNLPAGHTEQKYIKIYEVIEMSVNEHVQVNYSHFVCFQFCIVLSSFSFMCFSSIENIPVVRLSPQEDE